MSGASFQDQLHRGSKTNAILDFSRLSAENYSKLSRVHTQKDLLELARHLTWSGMAIRSPLIRVSTLLSSITEFMDSIHNVSTGASNRIHFSSGLSSENTKCEKRIQNHSYSFLAYYDSFASVPFYVFELMQRRCKDHLRKKWVPRRWYFFCLFR